MLNRTLTALAFTLLAALAAAAQTRPAKTPAPLRGARQ